MPSIAGVVGSMDSCAARYAARVSMQGGRQEIIVDLKGMVRVAGGGWVGVGGVSELMGAGIVPLTPTPPPRLTPRARPLAHAPFHPPTHPPTTPRSSRCCSSSISRRVG